MDYDDRCRREAQLFEIPFIFTLLYHLLLYCDTLPWQSHLLLPTRPTKHCPSNISFPAPALCRTSDLSRALFLPDPSPSEQFQLNSHPQTLPPQTPTLDPVSKQDATRHDTIRALRSLSATIFDCNRKTYPKNIRSRMT